MKGQKTNLILAGVLVVLGSFALWYEYKYRPAAERREAEQSKFLPELLGKKLESIRVVSRGPVQNLLLVCEDKDGCEVEKNSSHWMIQEPIKFRADEGALSGALSTLFAAIPLETFAIKGLDDPELTKFGLSPEKRVTRYVEVKVKGDKEPTVVYLGEKSAVEESLYALIARDKSKVRMISGGNEALLTQSLSHWRYKKLFDVIQSEISEVSFQSVNGGDFRLVRSKEGWFIEPGHVVADNESIEAGLSGIVLASATEFVSDDKATDLRKFDLPLKPKSRVTLSFEKKSPIVIEARDNDRKPAEQFITTSNSNIIAKIDLGTFQKFMKKRDEFRIHQLFRASDRFLMKFVKIQFGSSPKIEFSETEKGWAITSGGGYNFNSQKFSESLERLGATRIHAFLGKKAPGGIVKRASYDLLNKDKNPVRSLKFFEQHGNGKGAPSRWFVQFGDGEYAEIDGASAKGLPQSMEAFAPAPASAPVPAPPKSTAK